MNTDNKTKAYIGDEKKYWAYPSEHHTKNEGGSTKVHIINGYGFTLCGTNPKMASGTGEEATIKWVNQPDPDEQICKSCKKNFIRYNQNKQS